MQMLSKEKYSATMFRKTLDARWQKTGKEPGVQSKSKMHLTCLGWTVTINDFKKKLDKTHGKTVH